MCSCPDYVSVQIYVLRRRQREHKKQQDLIGKITALHVRFEFLYISLPYFAKQQRATTKLKVFSTLTPFQPVL